MAYTYVYGVKIQLSNNIELNGYVEFDRLLDSCHKSDFDKEHYKLETWESYWERLRNNITSGSGTIEFIRELIEIKGEASVNRFELSWLVASRSSVKKIKFADIKRIKGVCKKFDGRYTGIGVVIITDYMAEYISNHKMIATYTFDHEHVPPSDEEYAYGILTSVVSLK
jgi:hypothetical protein